jgi:hypothetical protein
MKTWFNPFIQYNYAMGIYNGSQAVGDNHTRPVLHGTANRFLDQVFRPGIQECSGLIQE